MELYNNGIITEDELKMALSCCLEKIDTSMKTFVTTFPSHSSINNVYSEDKNVEGWNQGFWTGILWIAYELTGNEEYRRIATRQIPTYTERIRNKLGVDHHDMGFLYTPSCVAAYKLTQNEEAKTAALLAADNLKSRYHKNGGFLQAWGDMTDATKYRLIIDCLLNIPLLYWASEVTGDEEYSQIAFNHFNATADNIMREDGSTYHTFYFDIATGAPLKGTTAQGASDGSCWARGQAWGIYGMMLTEIYKHNEKSISCFKKAADYFISYLPEDGIPFWDLSFSSEDGEPRDSSSAAIAICGMLEGIKYLPEDDADREKYLACACKMMHSLIESYLTKDIAESNGLLLHATYSKPDSAGVDECNIWGDYFFMEALIRFISGNKWKLYW